MNLIGSRTIETERLILRSSKMEEQKRLWEILMIPEVNKWYLTGAKKHANNPSHWAWENQEKFYKSKVDKADNNDVFVWSVFLKPEYTNSGYEEVIGQVSAQENGEDITIRDVGWYMDPAYQGKGYATEVAKAMIDYMFSEVEINGISSGAVKDNIRSCRMFEKLGFNKICEIEEESPYTFYDGILTFYKYLLVELEKYILSIDKDNLDQLHPEYREKMAILDLEEVKNNNGKCYIAVENDKAVGLIMGCIFPYDEYDYLDYKCPKRGEITELVVSKNVRSKGIGNMLMNKMEEYFKSLGCEYILVDVFAYNDNAIKFYDKSGYHSRMYTNIKKIRD